MRPAAAISGLGLMAIVSPIAANWIIETWSWRAGYVAISLAVVLLGGDGFILDIEVPMIAALNGPVLLHSQHVLLCDVVLATPSTVFQDIRGRVLASNRRARMRSPSD